MYRNIRVYVYVVPHACEAIYMYMYMFMLHMSMNTPTMAIYMYVCTVHVHVYVGCRGIWKENWKYGQRAFTTSGQR